MTTDDAHRWRIVEVLTRSGDERAGFCDAVRGIGMREDEVDARLVSDVLRSRRRVGATLDTRTALVELCSLLRAVDAAREGRISLVELRSGLQLHAGRTQRFEGFHAARVLLRTIAEVLDAGRAEAAAAATIRQVELLHAQLMEWLVEQLLGDGGAHEDLPEPVAAPDERAQWRITDVDERRAAHALLTELLEGAQGHPVTGLLGAAWIRGWSAIPVADEMLGDDPAELERLGAALDLLEPRPTSLVLVDRRRSDPWRIEDAQVVLGDGLRQSWRLPANEQGLRCAAAERSGWSLLTTDTLQFAYLEGAGHHAVLGPTQFVEQVCGMPVLEAMATFREHVEGLAGDGEPPPDLLEVASSFGRLRRRSR